MNLFDEYKKRRSEDGMTAAQAYKAASYKAAEAWRKELRGWYFNLRMIVSNMTEKHRKVWFHQAPSGFVITVKASFDYDVDQLDGMCRVEHHRHKEYRDQEVVSHKDGTYWIETQDGYALVELDDGGIETGWFRKQGYAKQPAIERAIESRKKMVSWIEDYVQGNRTYGCFEVCILRPDEYSDDGENAKTVSYAGPLGGVDCDDDEYLLETLNELFDEAAHELTI